VRTTVARAQAVPPRRSFTSSAKTSLSMTGY
jgi:hypothetical protein